MVKSITERIILERLSRRDINVEASALYKYTLEQLGFDSLDVMEIIIEIEGEVGYEVPSSKIHDINRVEDICNLFPKDDEGQDS